MGGSWKMRDGGVCVGSVDSDSSCVAMVGGGGRKVDWVRISWDSGSISNSDLSGAARKRPQ